MHLESEIIVPQTVDQVNEFFYEPTSLAKWDRSVKQMVPTGTNENGVATFDTIAPSGMKMSYRVIDLVPGKSNTVALENSKIFKEAIWKFMFDAVPGGTKITCYIDFKLRLKYFFMGPVLYFTRNALFRDLKFLREALDENFSAQTE